MARGKSTLRGGTLREVGSANSSELEARPNGDQKRKEKRIGGFWRRRSTAETPPIEGAGIAFLRRNSRKTPNCFGDRYMGQSAAANCGGERGFAAAAVKKQPDAIRPLNSCLGLSANVSTKKLQQIGPQRWHGTNRTPLAH
jgi:hypothetical protein